MGIDRLAAAFSLFLFASQTLSPAKEPAQLFPDGGGPGGDGDGPSPLEVKIETIYNFAGNTEFRGRTSDESGAFGLNLAVEGLLPLTEQWFIPLELKSQNIWMDTVPGMPVPEQINILELGAGLAYKPNEEWLFMLKGGPSLYKLDDIGSNDIGISGGLMAEWEYSKTWKWIFFAAYQSDNEFPVIPLVGFDWRINDRWSLSFPQLQLTYEASDRLRLSAGLDVSFGTTFRTSDTFGTELGLPRFNDAVASYSDVAAVAGMSYDFNDSVSLDLKAGYSFGREIEFTDWDEKVKFDDAPYVRMGFNVKF